MRKKRSNGVLERWSDADRQLPLLHHSVTPLLLAWYCANARDLPWRRTRDPYAIWVSEIMCQQTQIKTVIPYWERWMRELPDIASLAAAPADKLHKLWEGLGYYTRVRNMQKAAQFIMETHGGRFPSAFDDVLALPGIGRYTAGAICSIAFNQPTPILDGNVIRVLTRVFGITENPRDKQTNARLWELAEQLVQEAKRIETVSQAERFDADFDGVLNDSLGALRTADATPHPNPLPLRRGEGIGPCASVAFPVNQEAGGWSVSVGGKNSNARQSSSPSPFPKKGEGRGQGFPTSLFQKLNQDAGSTFPHCPFLNQSLMELGALVCTPRQPKCVECPIQRHCIAFRDNRAEELPNLGKRTTATERRFIAFVVERNGKFLVQQRPDGVVNAHLWEFPNCEITDKRICKIPSQFKPLSKKPILTVKHSITRYRIIMEVFRAEFSGRIEPRQKWLPSAQLEKIAFPSAHRKIVSRIAKGNHQ